MEVPLPSLKRLLLAALFVSLGISANAQQYQHQDFGQITMHGGPIGLSNWTTGTRPGSPSPGDTGWNTSIGALDIWNGSTWVNPATVPIGVSGATLGLLNSNKNDSGFNLFSNANTFSGGTVYTGSGSPSSGNTAPQFTSTFSTTNPTGEGRPFVVNTLADVTAAATSSVTLGIDSEHATTVGTFPFGSTSYNPQGAAGGEHQSAIYGHGQLHASPPMYLCTPGSTCPGTVSSANGVNAFADNISMAELYSARSIIVHSPTAASSFTVNGYSAGNGGTVDNWSVLSSDDAQSGLQVSQALGLVIGANSPYEFNGFGTGTPGAMLDTRCGNRTDTATGWISGNTLYLATPPGVAIAFGPSNLVTGTGGMVAAHLMYAASSAPVSGVTPGGFEAYTIDGSPQTVGSQGSPITFTFTETCIGLLVNNFTTGGLATVGFYSGAGIPNTLLGQIDQSVDSTAPLGNYIDVRIGGAPSVYVYGAGGSRPAGMAVGFTTPPPSLPLDALWVHGSEQVDSLIVNANGLTSISTTGNVGIGVGRVGVGNRLLIKGIDAGATNMVSWEDVNGNVLFRFEDTGLAVFNGNVVIDGIVTLNNTNFTLTEFTPASSVDPCVAGQFAVDQNFTYVCIQTNTWRRAALSAF